jgi:hypothetical protein
LFLYTPACTTRLHWLITLLVNGGKDGTMAKHHL